MSAMCHNWTLACFAENKKYAKLKKTSGRQHSELGGKYTGMAERSKSSTQVKGFCGLCIARCGTIATVEDGRFTRLDPDPTHPTGAAICSKGRAAPELVYSKDRLTHPLRRTNPKGYSDSGWAEITWDEALNEIASSMKRIAKEYGPQAFAWSDASPSTTALAESGGYIQRLMNAYGTPNHVSPVELCGWSRNFATRFAYGVGTVAVGNGVGAMPDIAKTGCLILWGYNPSFSRITHASAAVEALKRGMKLIVIDPRNAGLTNKAHIWLRIRPGTDGALALGLANLMIEHEWFDQEFVREWSNAPLLVHNGTRRLLTEKDVSPTGNPAMYMAWSNKTSRPVAYNPLTGEYDGGAAHLALSGEFSIATEMGPINCGPVFDHYTELCKKYTPEMVEAICWIPAKQLAETARMLWLERPVSYYAWSGQEQHANATETARAIALLYTLTGSFDASGGNVLLPIIPTKSIMGEDLPSAKNTPPNIGIAKYPLGPARIGHVSASEFYQAALESKPYPIRGLLGFGSNLLAARADPVRGKEALSALDFYAHADLFMTPTAELADIVLPISSCFEREALRVGFEIDAEAQSLIQLRQAVVPPPGEARSDTQFVFDLAMRLGFGQEFWNGDIDAAYRHQLAPSGITLEQLRDRPEGIRVPLSVRYKKYADRDESGKVNGFSTPTGKIEFWSEMLLEHGYQALPDFLLPESKAQKNQSEHERQLPLLITCAKPTMFCQSQHRSLPALRKRGQYPEIELHPDTAASRSIKKGDWVAVETSVGGMRAKVRFNDKLDPRVVIGEHGWWEACSELDLPGYDLFSSEGANYNHLVDSNMRDPISGTPGQRAIACEVSLASGGPSIAQNCR